MSPTVLVVDDEAPIRSILAAYLRGEGFVVVEAPTGSQALATVAGGDPPELVLLDIGLPDVDGLEVLRRIRTFSAVPVILVTARTEEVDKIIGLGVGADDYVTKPFSPREVVARVKAVLRRAGDSGAPHGGEHQEVHRFGDLVVDPTRREVRLRGDPVTLSALDFDLLVVLAGSPGRVFSRAQLLEKVWGYDFFGDERVVDVHIRAMRRALADDAADPVIIGTVRGVGYKFLLEPAGRTS